MHCCYFKCVIGTFGKIQPTLLPSACQHSRPGKFENEEDEAIGYVTRNSGKYFRGEKSLSFSLRLETFSSLKSNSSMELKLRIRRRSTPSPFDRKRRSTSTGNTNRAMRSARVRCCCLVRRRTTLLSGPPCPCCSIATPPPLECPSRRSKNHRCAVLQRKWLLQVKKGSTNLDKTCQLNYVTALHLLV